MAAVSAEPDPEIAASPVPATTATKYKEPVIHPTNAVAKSIILFAIPPFSMIIPVKIKNGIAIIVNLSKPP
mgnify:CR=1 FL=1